MIGVLVDESVGGWKMFMGMGIHEQMDRWMDGWMDGWMDIYVY